LKTAKGAHEIYWMRDENGNRLLEYYMEVIDNVASNGKIVKTPEISQHKFGEKLSKKEKTK
jgi:hypothetical protein